MMKLFCSRIKTPRGVFSVLFHPGGIYKINFPGWACAEGKWPEQPLPWPDFPGRLLRYLQGEAVDWGRYPLDRSGYTPFTASLLAAVSQIPRGTVCSYREIAAAAGAPRAWRAAGAALKANRHPLLVPCHRVIRSDGRAGGFSGPPGWKQMLLALEGVTVPD